MSASDTPPESPAPSKVSLEELEQSCRSLRTLLNLVMVSLLILIGSLSVVLLRDVSQARRQLKELTRFVDSYTTNSRPAMLEIRDKLHEFARTHPDYNTTFIRYFNPTNTPVSAQSPRSAPADSGASPVRLPNVPDR